MGTTLSECTWQKSNQLPHQMKGIDDQRRNRNQDSEWQQSAKPSKTADSPSMTKLVRKMSLHFCNYKKNELHAKILRVTMADRMCDRACGSIRISSPALESRARKESRDMLQDSLARHSAKDDSEIMSCSKSFHAFRQGAPWTFKDTINIGESDEIHSFIMFRVLDPTSYFYRFRIDDKQHLKPQKLTVHLVDIEWLKPHEQIVSLERVNGLKQAILAWNAFTEPLLIDLKTGSILDGHHRYTVAMQLRLKQIPAVLIDYLDDAGVTVDVWAECGRENLTKYEVIEMALSTQLFPAKTSRHRFVKALPPISVPLSVLKTPPRVNINLLPNLGDHDVLNSLNFERTEERIDVVQHIGSQELRRCQKSLRDFSMGFFCGAQSLAAKLNRTNRIRRIENNDRRYQARETFLDIVKRPTLHHSASTSFFDVIRVNDPSSSFCRQKTQTLDDFLSRETFLDIVKRPTLHHSASTSFFDVIRVNDPSSSFCRQKTQTLDDFLCSDAAKGITFYGIRVCDPTSYFYKFRLNACPRRSPQRALIVLADIKWLKPHEHVVSWDRVEGLRKATLRWNAYMEPLLVDSKTGAILDGHHRYHVGLRIHLRTVPVVLVDYLEDESITVDVWPNCGRDSLTKEEVIRMSLSEDVFPPKTSRHKFSDDLPPISVLLDRLRQPLHENQVVSCLNQ
ncbi:hypothetical protein ABG067_000192 [Albugo candida]